jgi:uncharacterized membrane protein
MNVLYAALEGVSPRWWWLWLVLIVAGAGFLFWTYRGIFQRSGRNLTWALMLLRGAGLLLLVLALARPTWTRETDQVEPGRIAVLLDNSGSMSLSDETGKTRYERARDALARLQQTLATEKGPRVVVDLFDVNGFPLREGPPEKPTANHTDLSRGLRRTLAWERSRLLLGVVVISDGADNSGRAGVQGWDEPGRPIYALGFPKMQAGELDLAVDRAQAQPRVRAQNEVPVQVLLSKKGPAPADATVSIRRGPEVLASQKVHFQAGEEHKEVSLTFTPQQPGSFVVTAAVEAATGERDLTNNAQNFPLRVDADPIRVLYLEGFLRYEYKFLKALLEDDPDVELTCHVRRESPELTGTRQENDFPSEEVLKDFHVVILGDMEGSFLTPAEYQRLLRWLDGKNHSLLILGGYRSLGPEGFAKTPLAEVLPVAAATAPPYQSEDSFTLRLTPEGERHPLFTLTRDPVKDAATWNSAPPLLGQALVGKVKPDAVELAVNQSVPRDGKPAPVLVVRRAGSGGQIMVMTADTTWRWSRVARLLNQPDTLYGRFWGQALRWLAGRALDDDRPLLSVSTDRPIYTVGKKVTVTLRRQQRPGADVSRALAAVEVRDPRGRAQSLTLKSNPAEPDRWTAEFYPEAGGRYAVTATLKDGDKLVANQAAEFGVQGADVEMADPATHPEILQDLAQATGGVYRELDGAEELAGRMGRKERTVRAEQRTEYWNSGLLFAGFLTLVTGEWFLRRRNHLV